MPVITVTHVNKYIASKLKSDRILQGIMVKGEISNFICHYKSGHCYFSLKDKESTLKAVMFASAAARLKFQPEDGMAVVASGSISTYERDGVYQLYVNDIIPEGAGKESVALEQLKKKLAAEGIFAQEHKRCLPRMPKKIGVVTSLSGAAVQDIINVLSRRYPICEIYAVDALVQGEAAPMSICQGILKSESAECDVIIVGRGGGSSEDLSAYNTEAVARAVYGCKVPVISAVGHEVDFSLADLAADMRAPTPSAAAELAAPDILQLAEAVSAMEKRCEKAVSAVFERKLSVYNSISARLAVQSPENRLKLMGEKLSNLEKRAETAALRSIDRHTAALAENAARLDSLSPLKVMARGYSLVYSGDELVRNSADLSAGQEVLLRFDKGRATAEIIEINGE
ncbi:MAG: exodeoxyribonuclease VII large subunit [Ruminococcus sp.]|nr:exodeoxyribonuclease VII large subunit [Ruminococcus sp.]